MLSHSGQKEHSQKPRISVRLFFNEHLRILSKDYFDFYRKSFLLSLPEPYFRSTIEAIRDIPENVRQILPFMNDTRFLGKTKAISRDLLFLDLFYFCFSENTNIATLLHHLNQTGKIKCFISEHFCNFASFRDISVL